MKIVVCITEALLNIILFIILFLLGITTKLLLMLQTSIFHISLIPERTLTIHKYCLNKYWIAFSLRILQLLSSLYRNNQGLTFTIAEYIIHIMIQKIILPEGITHYLL